MITQLTLNEEYKQPDQEITEAKKGTQRIKILDMLAFKPRSCMEFMQAGIAQYNARIKELRESGLDIEYDRMYKVFRLVR